MKGNLDPIKITKYWKNLKPPKLLKLKEQNQKFTDPYFPPNTNSLQSKNERGQYTDPIRGPELAEEMGQDCPGWVQSLAWKRVTDIKPKWELFEGKIEFDDVKQGSLGDCYFLSAISALAEFPYIIREKFRTNKFNEYGYYEMIFFIDGEWQIVFVDDYFPVSKYGNQFYFAKPNNSELWAILLEKAWCKINGGFTNAIGGIVSEALHGLTGFATEQYRHEEIDEYELFEKVEEADKQGTIMSSSSKAEESHNKLESSGIVSGHAYTLIEAKAKKENDIYLVKLRNPWGSDEWKGEWSDNSKKWTPELKKYFGYQNVDDGTFWMNIENYYKYFCSTNICYLLYGALIKSYYFEHEQHFKSPVVFNIQITKPGKLSVSVVFRQWRFNREIDQPNRPFTIVLCKYNRNREVEMLKGTFSSDEDNSDMVTDVQPGFYALWLYCSTEAIKNDKEFKYTLVLASTGDFNAQFIGMDYDFLFIQKIIMSNYQRTGANNINSSKDYFYGSDRDMSSIGLKTIIILNKTKDSWLNIDTTISTISNVNLLPPYRGMKSIKIIVPPLQWGVIVGQRLSYQSTQFAFSSNISFERNRKAAPPQMTFENFMRFELDSKDTEEAKGLRQGGYKFIAKEKTDQIPLFNTKSFIGAEILKKSTFRIVEITHESLSKEFQIPMAYLDKLSPLTHVNKLNWDKIESDEGTYIGEIDSKNGNLHGRGIFIWKKDQKKYIGYFAQGKMSQYGTVYDKKFNKIYEGEYDNGARSGKGKLYITQGEYCEGVFINNNLKGPGIYYYANGDKWEGLFESNSKNGVGMMTYANGDKYIVQFAHDSFLGKTPLKEEESRELEQTKKEDKKQEKALLSGISIFKKYVARDFDNIMEKIYNEKTQIQSSVIVQELDHEVVESEEKKQHNKYLEILERLKVKDTFMYEQFIAIREQIDTDNIVFIDDGKIKYIGNIASNRKEGHSGYFNGSHYYFGLFIFDCPNGFFRKFNKDKKIVYEGLMESDYRFGSSGTIYFSTGNTYTGDLKNEAMNGYGTYYFEQGGSWTGTFVNNTFHGTGKYYYENGLLTEDFIYENNKAVSRSNLQREDYSIPNIELFYDNIKSKYPGVIERLLKIIPLRKAIKLKWGAFNLQDGSTYVGETDDNHLFNGRGCIIGVKDINPNSYYYVGYFAEGKQNGNGTLFNQTWNVLYEGEFKTNMRHGFGKAFRPDGGILYGKFENNGPNGPGVYYFPNETRYEGTFINGESNDLGYLITENYTQKQKIQYKDGNIINQEDIIYCNKGKHLKILQKEISCLRLLYPKYTQLFLDLKFTYDHAVLTQGVKDFVDGTYIGEFNNVGFKHGRGVLLKPNTQKMIYLGYFENNMKEGEGRLFFDDETPQYSGNFHNNKPCGYGKYFYKSKDVLEGTFNEVGEGIGVYTFAKGNQWKGPFFALMFHGIGEYSDKEGKLIGMVRYELNKVKK